MVTAFQGSRGCTLNVLLQSANSNKLKGDITMNYDIKMQMTKDQYDSNEAILEQLSINMEMNIRVEDINTGDLIMLLGGKL